MGTGRIGISGGSWLDVVLAYLMGSFPLGPLVLLFHFYRSLQADFFVYLNLVGQTLG